MGKDSKNKDAIQDVLGFNLASYLNEVIHPAQGETIRKQDILYFSFLAQA